MVLIEQVEKAVRWERALTFVRDRQANPTKSQLYYTAKRPTPTLISKFPYRQLLK